MIFLHKIICFKKGCDTFWGLNPFYKVKYTDTEIPGGVIRKIYCPNFKNNRAENSFLKRISPLVADGAVLDSGISFSSLQAPKIPVNMDETINKNITSLVLSVYKNRPVNIVIYDESCLPYIAPLVPRIQPDIVSQGGNCGYISDYLLDEYGISLNIKKELDIQNMHGRLSVFMPQTTPPKSCNKLSVLNFSGKYCDGSIDENGILYRLPPGFENLKTAMDNDVKKIFSVLEYLSVKTENISMVIPDML